MAKNSSPENILVKRFSGSPSFEWFGPRQLGRLKSEIVRLQKVLEDTQDYLGLQQYNAFRNRKTSGPKSMIKS